MERLRKVTSIILDSQKPAYTLRPEVLEMITILVDSQANWFALQEHISEGETRTLNGLALSPSMAAMCADDFVRTIEFIRGTHAAIVDIRKQFPDRAARVLYIGCGPYATLAVPLMSFFSSAEVIFTLLDIHPESIASAKTIIETLELCESVLSYEVMDAASYRVAPDQHPDVILIEIMQACLESEPQVAITRHLLNQAPDAILLPEEVRVDLLLVDPSHEFNTTELEMNRSSIQRDRVFVGSVFVVNKETVSLWDKNANHRLLASTVQIPGMLEQRYQLMLFTVIGIYGRHVLSDYDSGLTCPKLLTIEGDFQAGDEIQFYYELGRHPHLTGTNMAGT